MRNRFKRRYSGIYNSGINPKGFHTSQIKFYLVLLPLVLFMLLPIVFIFSNAFKPPDELFAYPPRFIVANPTFKNFSDLFTKLSTSGVPVSRYLFNSITITAVTVTGVNSCANWTPEAGFDGSLAPDESVDFSCTFTVPANDFTWEADGNGTDALGDPVPFAGEHVEGTVDVVKPATVLSSSRTIGW